MREAAWRQALNAQEQATETDESRAMKLYIRSYVQDALDGRVAAIEMTALSAVDTAYAAILGAHEARIGRELDQATRSEFWMVVAVEWKARRDRLRAQLRETQERLCSPFSVFGKAAS